MKTRCAGCYTVRVSADAAFLRTLVSRCSVPTHPINCPGASHYSLCTCVHCCTAALSFILHLDKHLSAMIQQHGTATYAILWTIVFCETGLVLTPFLPGDSLLFAAGAFAGLCWGWKHHGSTTDVYHQDTWLTRNSSQQFSQQWP